MTDFPHVVPTDATAESPRFRRSEVITLVSVVAILITLESTQVFTQGTLTLGSILSVLTALAMLLFLRSPVVAVVVMAAIVVGSLFVPLAEPAIPFIPWAVAAAFVVRYGSGRLIGAYGLISLLSHAVLVSRADASNAIAVLIVGALAAVTGLAVRNLDQRSHSLTRALEREQLDAEDKARRAALEERKWMAAELHDSIAHHVTVVALHAQLLDDKTGPALSHQAIRDAARKALSDIRYMVQLSADPSETGHAVSGDLAATVAEAEVELSAAGHTVTVTGDTSDERMPRGIEIILARVMREATTNTLKYAGPGPVTISLAVNETDVSLTISSPLAKSARESISSTKTGVRRLTDRVREVGGVFSAEPRANEWVVFAKLPIVQTKTAIELDESLT